MQKLRPTISIIIPTYNGANFLRKNLDSIKNLNNLSEIELIIVDNMSTDSSIDVIKAYEKEININLLENSFNEGFSSACNFGVKHSDGKFVFITNQDVIFPPDFFEKLIKIYNDLKKDQEIIISPALVFKTGKIHYFGAKNHFLGFSYTPELGEKLPKNKIIKRTQRFSGGTLFIEKDLFLKMGGFDKEFFMYYEDTDLSLKMIRNGCKIYTTNDPFLIHQKNHQTLNDFQYYFLERNRFIVIIKNVSNIQKLLPFIIIFEIIPLIHSLLIKKFKIRVKIYQEIMCKFKYYKNLREMSKREGDLISYQKLSKTLDPILLGKLQRLKVLVKFFNLLNRCLKLV